MSSTSNRPVEGKRWEVPEQVEQLLLEAKGENQALEEKMKLLRTQLSHVEKELESTKERSQLSEVQIQKYLKLMLLSSPFMPSCRYTNEPYLFVYSFQTRKKR